MPVGSLDKIEAYLSSLPASTQQALRRLRGQIQRAAPKAQEGFGYGFPGFYLEGPLFYYGAGKNHCALYGSRPAGFEEALDGFVTSKGAVRFAPDKPLPATLVRRLVKAKIAANQAD